MSPKRSVLWTLMIFGVGASLAGCSTGNPPVVADSLYVHPDGYFSCAVPGPR